MSINSWVNCRVCDSVLPEHHGVYTVVGFACARCRTQDTPSDGGCSLCLNRLDDGRLRHRRGYQVTQAVYGLGKVTGC